METIQGKKITIFTSEEKRFHHRPLFEAILDKLKEAGVSTATVTRGIAGFGNDRKVSTINIEVLSYSLPIVIEATDAADKIDAVVPTITAFVEGGVIEVMPVQIIAKSLDHTESTQ